MGLLEDMDQRVKRFSLIDVTLAQGAAMFFGLFIAKLIPQIMNINIWWFIALMVLSTAKPSCVFWFKK